MNIIYQINTKWIMKKDQFRFHSYDFGRTANLNDIKRQYLHLDFILELE